MANSEGKSNKTKDGRKRTSVPYRCAIKWIAKIADQIRGHVTESQLELLKNTPFGPFYNLFHSKKMPDESNVKMTDTIQSILSCYDPKLGKFRIGSKLLIMTAKDIAVQFGMKLEGEIPPVFPRGAKRENKMNSFVAKCIDTQTGKFMKKQIKAAILKTAGVNGHDDEFVQLVTLYMCITIFFVNQAGNTLGGSFYENIKDLKTINSISWPNLICGHVMDSLKDNFAHPLDVTGCVLSFVYWVCEHTNVTHRRQRWENQFPRVGNWSLFTITNELPKELATLPIEKNYLVPFTSEEEILIRTVMEEERYASSDEEEKSSDTKEMIRLKRKFNYLGGVMRRRANRIRILKSQVSCENPGNVRGESSFINLSERLLNAAPVKKQILLILDLNGILGYFSPTKGDALLRPHCQDFVDFCLSSFVQVLFWSSMVWKNTQTAMAKILPPILDGRGFNYVIWCQSQCTKLERNHPDDNSKPWFLKKISEIKKTYPKMLFNERNIIMVDDSPLKTVLNPANTAVFPEPWVRGDTNDDTLSQSGDIRHFLNGLPDDGDIREYVETKQPASFGKKKADERIREVWTSSKYAGYLSDLLKKERTEALSTEIAPRRW